MTDPLIIYSDGLINTAVTGSTGPRQTLPLYRKSPRMRDTQQKPTGKKTLTTRGRGGGQGQGWVRGGGVGKVLGEGNIIPRLRWHNIQVKSYKG